MRAFATDVARQTDVGGLIPGSDSTTTTEIFGEGRRIPGVHFCEAGRLDQAILDIIGADVRVPCELPGDLRAQLAAVDAGERGYHDLMARYGAEGLAGLDDALLTLSDMEAPKGRVVNPLFPAACGARGITGFRIMDEVSGAPAQAVPNGVPADGEGGNSLISIGARDGSRQPFVQLELLSEVRGAGRGFDRPSGVPHSLSNDPNMPIEIAESTYRLRFLRHGMVEDSASPGQWRGAPALVREFELTIGPVMGPSAIRTRDLLRHDLANGDGWGDPLARDPDAVLKDVRNGILGVARAAADYSVVIGPNETVEVEASPWGERAKPVPTAIRHPPDAGRGRRAVARQGSGGAWVSVGEGVSQPVAHRVPPDDAADITVPHFVPGAAEAA